MASPLLVMDLEKTWIACIFYVQSRQFSSEIDILQRGQPVGKRNPFRDLDPFLDSDGIIRVGEILPRGCHLGRFVVDRAHKAALHGGQALSDANAIRNT